MSKRIINLVNTDGRDIGEKLVVGGVFNLRTPYGDVVVSKSDAIAILRQHTTMGQDEIDTIIALR